jgi:hypothetical protein
VRRLLEDDLDVASGAGVDEGLHRLLRFGVEMCGAGLEFEGEVEGGEVGKGGEGGGSGGEGCYQFAWVFRSADGTSAILERVLGEAQVSRANSPPVQ